MHCVTFETCQFVVATNHHMKRKDHPKLNSSKRVAYRLREVSEMTGVPASTLRTMVRRGELNPVTSFGVWLITAEELEVLLQKRLRNHREPAPHQPQTNAQK